MIENFKIYITTLDEERLIPHTIAALVKVFEPEQIEIIDLGSKDRTLDRIPEGMVLHHRLMPDGRDPATNRNYSGPAFTALKKAFSEKQEWCLWVDGDEIYPTSVLLKMRAWLEGAIDGEHAETALRVYWKVLKEENGDLYISNEYLSAGPKLFSSKHHNFKRAWPAELIAPLTDEVAVGSKSDFTGIWFWHGVLLKRTDVKERTARKKKRVSKDDRYNKYMTWSKLDVAPWDADYDAPTASDWTVLNMSPTQGAYNRAWRGTLTRIEPETPALSSSPSIVITGPARSGTTFLTALMRALGYGIGFSLKKALDSPRVDGGLEFLTDPNTRTAARSGRFPEVVKQPYPFFEEASRVAPSPIFRWHKNYKWKLSVVICTRREALANVKSQVERLIESTNTSYTEEDRASLEESILLERPGFVDDMEDTVKTYPHVFIEFPRMVTDWRYCYETLKPWLKDDDEGFFHQMHLMVANPKLVSYKDKGES